MIRSKNSTNTRQRQISTCFRTTFLTTVLTLAAGLLSFTIYAQNDPANQAKVVTITGARFTYPLVQKWIDDYYKVNPQVQIIIESRGTNDPAKYDILVEVYEQDEAVRNERQYLYVGRYAIVPVANSNSTFARTYSDKGLNRNVITQIYFHDIFADRKKEDVIKEPYAVYTRLQKAGIPIVFTHYFGFEQKDIRGKAIAGSDEHLLKALLRDSTGVSYLPLSLAFDRQTQQAVAGLSVLPVDLNGNGKVASDEHIFTSLGNTLADLEQRSQKELNNIPIGDLHLSVNKANVSPEAIEFLRWVLTNGRNDLHDFGYLLPTASPNRNQKFEEFSSKRGN